MMILFKLLSFLNSLQIQINTQETGDETQAQNTLQKYEISHGENNKQKKK